MLVDDHDYDLEFQESLYTQAGKTRMGDVDFFVYKREGAEPLLITPTFIVEFLEAVEKIKPLMTVKSPKAIRIRLNRLFGGAVTENAFEEDDEYEYIIRYRDVDLRLYMKERKLFLEPFFRIYSSKLIDSRKNVNVEDFPQLQEYFNREAEE